MLRQLLPRGYPLYERSRFAQDLEDFAGWLEATGYGHDYDCIGQHGSVQRGTQTH